MPESLDGHAGDVLDVDVQATGRELVTVSADQTAIRWDMTPAERPASGGPRQELHRLCAVAGRDLTPAEWARYLPDHRYAATCTDLQ
jgi:hypothetical protein